LFTDTKEIAYKNKKEKPQFTFSDIAKNAAKKAHRQNLRKQDNDFGVANYLGTTKIATEFRRYVKIDIINLKAFALSGRF